MSGQVQFRGLSPVAGFAWASATSGKIAAGITSDKGRRQGFRRDMSSRREMKKGRDSGPPRIRRLLEGSA